MRRITLCCLALALFAAAPLHAQPDSLWAKTFGGDGIDVCNSLIQTADGGCVQTNGWDAYLGERGDEMNLRLKPLQRWSHYNSLR
jgi:hypothetical protein